MLSGGSGNPSTTGSGAGSKRASGGSGGKKGGYPASGSSPSQSSIGGMRPLVPQSMTFVVQRCHKTRKRHHESSVAALATLARSTLLAATQREQDKLVPLKYQYHLRPFRSRLPRGKAATADMADERRFEDIPMTQLVEQVMPLVPRLSSIHDYSVASPTRSV